MKEFSDFAELQSNNDPTSYCQAWDECAKYYQDNNRYLYEAPTLRPEGESRGYADDATWILTSSFVIFTMQSGFGMLEAGSCSPGFEVNILMKNIIDVVFTALMYYLVGYGISFGEPSTPFMGKGCFPADGGYDEVPSGLRYSQYVFQLSFAATSTTIVSGAVAMRLKFFVYVLYSLIAVIFYSFVAHWTFAKGGFLKDMGAYDFAGGASVHVFGGINGLIATLFLGPRTGRFDGTKPIKNFFPSSPVSQCLGLFCLWWGWIGFNCGSSFGITNDRWVVAIRCAVTTINSTVGGGITGMLYSLWRTERKFIIPEHVINGILGSLVAITPACAVVNTYDAFPIGIIGALVALGCNTFHCYCHIDDPVGAVGVHAGAGTWGLLAVGLFADCELPGVEVMDGLFRGGGFKLLGLQVVTIVCTMAWAIMWSTIFFYIVGIILSRDWRDPRKGLRVTREEEEQGADLYFHGVINYDKLYTDSCDDDDDPTDMFGENGDDRIPHRASKSELYERSIFYRCRFEHLTENVQEQGDANLDIDKEEAERAVDDTDSKVGRAVPGDRYSDFVRFLSSRNSHKGQHPKIEVPDESKNAIDPMPLDNTCDKTERTSDPMYDLADLTEIVRSICEEMIDTRYSSQGHTRHSTMRSTGTNSMLPGTRRRSNDGRASFTERASKIYR
mmetsp:Transcript_29060/g.53108  ORF Transcript_29060/g.53108 Transcript_29060/m.53108 type:complete len:672 (-) Transcript_29060:466-2481(-)